VARSCSGDEDEVASRLYACRRREVSEEVRCERHAEVRRAKASGASRMRACRMVPSWVVSPIMKVSHHVGLWMGWWGLEMRFGVTFCFRNVSSMKPQ
jgi:hypothetical protein